MQRGFTVTCSILGAAEVGLMIGETLALGLGELLCDGLIALSS